ncbi:MAG: TRAP-type C4-dicarboxylate transport system permease small subunit [Pseudohongiellaceae bacterium]|jgi:TRAP-type C4-dicarboxylate transport system permease small subunit
MLKNSSTLPSWVQAINGVLVRINKFLIIIAAMGLVMIALLIGADVLGRGLFGSPIIGVAEIAANTLIIIAFLQLPYTVHNGGMLRTEMIDTFAPRVIARLMWFIGYLLGALFFSLIAVAEWEHMVSSWVTGEFEGHVSFAVPVFPSRLAIVGGSLLAVLTYLLLAVPAAIALFTGNEEPLKTMNKSELSNG